MITLTNNGARPTLDLLGSSPDLTAGIPESFANPIAAEMESPWMQMQADAEKAARQRRAAQLEKLDSALLDPETFFKKNPFEPQFTTDAEKSKRRVLVSAALRMENGGKPVPMGADGHELMRRRVAAQRFQGRGAEDDDAFHAELVKAATGRRDERAIFSGIAGAAADDGFLPVQNRRGMAAVIAEAKAKPGFDTTRQADYAEAYAEASRAIADKIEPFRETLDFTWMAAKNKAMIPREKLAEISDGDWPEFLSALRLRAETLPDAEKETFLSGMRKDLMRSLESFGRQAGEAFTTYATAPAATGFEPGDLQGPGVSDAVRQESNIARNRAHEVRRILDSKFDVIEYVDGMGWLQKAPGVTATSLSMAVPIVGPAVMAASMQGAAQESLYMKFRDKGLNEADAGNYSNAIAPAVMIPQAALEMVGFGIISRKLPGVSKALTAVGDRITNRALRLGVTGGLITAGETTTEVLQNFTESVVQDIAHEIQPLVPDVDLSKEFTGAWAQAPEIAGSMIFLSLFGAAGGLSREAQAAAWAEATPLQRAALGITPEASAAIDAAAKLGPSSLTAAVDEAWQTRDPNSETAKTAVEELKQTAAMVEKASRSGWFPVIQQSADGYVVLDGETREEVATAPDMAGAFRIAQTHSAALDDRRAEKTAYLATMLEAGDEALDMAGDKNAKNSFELGTLYTEAVAEAESPDAIDRFRMQTEMRERVNGGDSDVVNVALGRNIEDTRGLVRTFTNRLFRGASVLTVVHETGHGMYRRARNANVITRAETLDFVKAYNAVQTTGKLKRGTMKGERVAFLEEGLADDQITEDMLEEAVQEILEAEILRTRKRGKDQKSLPVSGGIISRNLLALSRMAPGATRKFRALIESARGVFGLAAARALNAKKAIREGTLKETDIDSFITKMTGRDWQAEYDGTIRDEHTAIVGKDAGTPADNAPFSLRPARMVEALEINAAARIKDPEVKMGIFENLISKISRLKRDRDEIKTAFGKPYERKAIAEPRGASTIRKDYALRKEAAREKLENESGLIPAEGIPLEAARLLEIRREELEEAALARHEGVLSNPDLVKLKEWPVHAWLANPDTPLRGRLKSKSSAMREAWFSDKTGDFDGADGVPRSNFGGSLMPDQAAQELYEAGLIKHPTPDALWDALKKEAAQVPKFKEALKAAKADIAAAREQAKEDIATWERGERIKRQELEDAKQASDAEIDEEMQAELKTEADAYSPRQRLLRSLAMLDAMLSVLPAEVRGKVGGYVQLAKLTSDESRLKFLEERIGKIEEALDEFIGKEYRKTLDKLVESAAPKKDKAGKKRKGHLGAEAHRFFTHVRAALDMGEDTLMAALAKVDENLMEETDPETLADLAEEWQILRSFGNFDEKALIEKHDALELAQKVFKDGKNMWRTLEETRIQSVRAAAAAATAEAGGGDVRDVQKAKADGRTAIAALTEKHWNLRSFREVLDLAFGEDSATAQHFGNAARRAFAARTKAMIKLQRRWKDAMESATGKKGRAARQVVYEMQTVQSIDELVSPQIYDEIKIPIDTFFDAEKKATLGLSKEEIARLTEQFENLPENSQRKYLTLKRQIKTGEGEARMAKFTEAEAVQLTMLWAQDEYKKALEKHGFGVDFQAAIESKLSPAAKELRKWLADYYRDEFPAIASLYRRMFGVDLRQTENYAPGTFWHTGTNETPLDPSAGVVTGGAFKQGMGTGGEFAQGFLRQRKQHKAVPRIKNAFDLFFSHANQTEHWKAMAELSREMHGVFGNPSVKIAMEARSPAAANALREWLNAIDGNGVAMSPSGKLMKYLLESQAYMAMAWKVSTAAKNAVGAAVNVAYGMPLHEYIRGMGRLVSGKLDTKEILKSDVIQNKLHGGFSPEIRAAVTQALNGKPTWRGDMLMQGLEIHGKADAFGNAIGATIAFDYHFRKGLDSGMSEKQARTVAMELTEDSIARLSQPAEIIDRSLFELNMGTFGKLMFLFASEARQKSSLYLTALGHTATLKASRKDLRVIFISHLVIAPLMQAIGSVIKDAMGPDDDELFDEKYWNPRDFIMAALTGPFAGIPLMRDIFSGFTGNNSPLGNYVRGGKSLWDLFADEPTGDEMRWYESKVNQVLQGIGAFPGVAGNVIKQVMGTAENTKNLTK